MPLRVALARPIVFTLPVLGARDLNVPQIWQEQTLWCWAACADMVLHYYGNVAVRQCDFVNWLFGQSTCCVASSASSSLCNRTCQIGDVSRVYTNWAIYSLGVNRAVSFAALQLEINNNRPVEVAYSWNGGGGHVAIVKGWNTDATGPFVIVNDPWYGSGGVYYSDLLTAYGYGTWFYTWIGIRR